MPEREGSSAKSRTAGGAVVKAIFERTAAACGLLLLSPLLAAIAIAILTQDGAPILFTQKRVGRFGRPFRLLKFRSMRTATPGANITAAGDPRVTRTGSLLRKYKLDELPQLWNVLKGDMSLVGPRPEVPCFVDTGILEWRRVLQVRPGITDLATLIHRDEEAILRAQPDPEEYYRTILLPAKMELSLSYIESSTLGTDMKLIFFTLYFSAFPQSFEPARIRRMFRVSA
jgi:lipopolysaccharide/colanic/teichoic acid biosynthesis glycosyltransferase